MEVNMGIGEYGREPEVDSLWYACCNIVSGYSEDEIVRVYEHMAEYNLIDATYTMEEGDLEYPSIEEMEEACINFLYENGGQI